MGRGRRRTKMENNPRDTEEEIKNSDSLPVDLLVDIFLRLPATSVARLVGVSKLFATIIRSKDFTRLRSSKQKQQRILLAFTELDKEKGRENWFFFSSSLTFDEESSSPSSLSLSTSTSSPVFLCRMACPAPDLGYDRPDCVHGLISFVYGQEQAIGNPSTGKSITLPLVKSRKSILRRYFGYDPVDDQFKVLCVTEPMFGTGMRVAASDQCQVLTLGLGSSSHDKNSWRKIECSIPHRPRSSGVCINGVLYYFANMSKKMMEFSLVRFQVRSEEFHFLTRMPGEAQWCVKSDPKLINYQGNVALVNRPFDSMYTFDLWVLEDFEKQQWVKVILSLGPWKSEIRRRYLDIRGTAQTGEIIYASYSVDDFYLLHHDRKMNYLNVGEIGLEESSEYEFGRFGRVVSFLDYVQSFMLS